MHPLAELKERIMREDRPSTLIRLADRYFQLYEVHGDDVVIPQRDAVIAPVILYLANDLPAWCNYVRKIRDALPLHSDQRRDVFDVYEDINARRIQRDLRRRGYRARDIAVQTRLIPDETQAKARFINKISAVWKAEKDERQYNARKLSKYHRLPQEEREQILSDFWREIDEQLAEGRIPHLEKYTRMELQRPDSV